MTTVSIDGLLLEDSASEVTLDGGRYTIVGRLGSGGMARVYLAWDGHLSVWRAVKLLNARRTKRRWAIDRFLREARWMAGIDHPHLVRVYDFEWHQGRPYIVMEAVSGGSLWDWMDRHHRPLHPRDAVEAAAATCRALAAAHARGVIHRDIKPNNVLIAPDGQFKLTDFGIAMLQGHAREQRGSRLGTDGFLAPEQEVDAGSVDVRADLYGVGATLFTLVTGLRPRQLYRAAEAPALLRPVPRVLRSVIARTTAYRAEERPADAIALMHELDALALDLPERPSDLPPIYECQVELPGPASVPTGPTVLARQRALSAGASTVPMPAARVEAPVPIDAVDAFDEREETTLRPKPIEDSHLAAGTAGFLVGASVIGLAAAALLALGLL